jgi:hypothetical protein
VPLSASGFGRSRSSPFAGAVSRTSTAVTGGAQEVAGDQVGVKPALARDRAIIARLQEMAHHRRKQATAGPGTDLPLAHRRRRGGWRPGQGKHARFRRRHPARAARDLTRLRVASGRGGA